MSTACIIDYKKTLTKEEIKRIVEENNKIGRAHV